MCVCLCALKCTVPCADGALPILKTLHRRIRKRYGRPTIEQANQAGKPSLPSSLDAAGLRECCASFGVLRSITLPLPPHSTGHSVWLPAWCDLGVSDHLSYHHTHRSTLEGTVRANPTPPQTPPTDYRFSEYAASADVQMFGPRTAALQRHSRECVCARAHTVNRSGVAVCYQRYQVARGGGREGEARGGTYANPPR